MNLRDFDFFRDERMACGGLQAQVMLWLERLDEAHGEDPAIWISRAPREALLARAAELDARGAEGMPLFGLPFAVKDNIDVSGFPTTAACPDYAYEPDEDATVVAALLAAGAICLGKTNLDQFATGLVGVRSPYGIPRNALNPEFVPGGSSAGSAVAVARGLAAFSLGTDTAGSGRVPAAFHGLVGWKPTRGLLSNHGVVPACRSLDCVSVFTSNVADAEAVAAVTGQFDPKDAWSRRAPAVEPRRIRRIAVPPAPELEFFGDTGYEACWHAKVANFEAQGFEMIEVSFAAFFETARLLYEGPWVTERYVAVREVLEKNPESMHPVTRKIIEAGAAGSAADVFAALYRLEELRRASESVWEVADAICTPTAGTIYRIAEVEAEPIALNSNLGRYTNFMNLLDLCAIALPAGVRDDGMPFGVTVAVRAFGDADLFAFAGGGDRAAGGVELAVCGAHMRGLPLEKQLLETGAHFDREALTAPVYRMYALDAMRPGLVRSSKGGAALPLEVWRIPSSALGALVVKIPTPLGLGQVQLADGSKVCGFLCEVAGVGGKQEITDIGGWREWLAREES